MDKARIKKFSQYARSKLIPQMQDMIDFWMGAEEVSGGLRIGTQFFNDSKQEQYTLARKSLIQEVERYGKESVADHAAYTRFNRIIALRYMELHGYLPINSSLFVSSDGSQTPDIVKNALYEYSNCGLEESLVLDLESKHNYPELYRFIFIGLCNKLSDEYGFLFSKINDWSVLLFPKDILTTNHIIKDSSNGLLQIPDKDWQEVEIIGWMYQYYISERKEELDKSTDKLASGDDIAASTQLFTPEWIVKYIVHNTVGKISEAKLSHKIETTHTFSYNIENIESFKVLDPAVGSGHILVRAYDVLKDVYESRGYSPSQIPQLILENNLYGIDICPRAHQLACFAVLMKAKADDDLIHTKIDITKHLICIIENNNFMEIDDKKYPHLRSFLQLRYNASMYGSLIRIPKDIDEVKIRKEFLQFQKEKNLFANGICDNQTLELLFNQTDLLDDVYDCTVANPPYKGGGKVNLSYSKFLSTYYPEEKADLFAVFIIRCLELCKHGGFVGMVTMHSWMFLSSYEELRKKLLQNYTIDSLVHHGAHGFPEISGEIVQTVSFVLYNNHDTDTKGIYIDLTNEGSAELKEEKLISITNKKYDNDIYNTTQKSLMLLPGSIIAYKASKKIGGLFINKLLGSESDIKQGMSTANNDLFLRIWAEIDYKKLFHDRIPYNKGGGFKKRYGSIDHVISWVNNGKEIKEYQGSAVRNESYFFKEGITRSAISSTSFSVRKLFEGNILGGGSNTIFLKEKKEEKYILGLLNSKVSEHIVKLLNPTVNFSGGVIEQLPIIKKENSKINKLVDDSLNISIDDRNLRETSWDFQQNPLIDNKKETIEQSYQEFCKIWAENFFQLYTNEEELNRQFIEIYGLQDEITPDVPLNEITILQEELETKKLKENSSEIIKSHQLPRKKDVIAKQLMSYIAGCIMGRYSLDVPGLVYAGGKRDPSKYKTFLPDGDDVVPVLEDTYFEDDIVERTKAFIKTVRGEEQFGENRKRLAQALDPESTKSSEVVIREYRCKKFMDDHYSTYSKRPIYWYFASSPKKGKAAFQAIVYLHRISSETISRLRYDYVHKFQAKLEAEYESLKVSADRKSEKRMSQIVSIQAELAEYDKKLKNFADKNITLDLDDGVKHNYGLLMKEGIVADYKL